MIVSVWALENGVPRVETSRNRRAKAKTSPRGSFRVENGGGVVASDAQRRKRACRTGVAVRGVGIGSELGAGGPKGVRGGPIEPKWDSGSGNHSRRGRLKS